MVYCKICRLTKYNLNLYYQIIFLVAERSYYTSGFFDGSISIYSHEDKKVGKLKISDQGIRSIAAHPL